MIVAVNECGTDMVKSPIWQNLRKTHTKQLRGIMVWSTIEYSFGLYSRHHEAKRYAVDALRKVTFPFLRGMFILHPSDNVLCKRYKYFSGYHSSLISHQLNISGM
ncbi:hypothetical protein TNCV_4988621 [Trichonephila clavipes]|nr:hypothetical protein TNCV_4988621 [Trichonephila clavipes]